jgi:hypothetical protein
LGQNFVHELICFSTIPKHVLKLMVSYQIISQYQGQLGKDVQLHRFLTSFKRNQWHADPEIEDVKLPDESSEIESKISMLADDTQFNEQKVPVESIFCN